MNWSELFLLYGGMSLLAASPVLGRRTHTRLSIGLFIIGILMLACLFIIRSV